LVISAPMPSSLTEHDQQILDAARVEFETYGLRRANMDSVAKRAGVGRSTLYRRFPNKEALFAEVVRHQGREFLRALDAAIDGCGPKAAVVEAFAATAQLAHRMPLVARLLDSEPEALFTPGTAPGGALLREEFSARIATALKRCGSTMEQDDLLAVSEILQRVAISMVLFPGGQFDLADTAAVRRYAERHLTRLVD
jgi:TetR/AcrR family transcriptional regulator